VVIVSEAFRSISRTKPVEDHHFSAAEHQPAGRQSNEDRAHVIVGIVGDVKNQTLRG
jgi:hypothetical protein